MKKYLFYIIAGIFSIIPFAAAFADHTSQHTIEQLQAQLQALNNKINDIQHRSAFLSLPVTKTSEQGQNIPSFNQNLYFGMRNNENVRDLQEFLIDQGYYAGPVTGNYFLLTFQAVKKFQSANGISPTGYFGVKSRTVATEIIQKIIGTICPREEDCPGDILPPQELQIITQSDLRGTVSEYFVAVFNVSGGSGNYSIKPEGNLPPGLSWTGTYCPPLSDVACAQVVSPDSITLYGTPAKKGIFDVVLYAKEVYSCPPGAFCAPLAFEKYGKARFTIVVSDKIIVDQPPVISGVKGPTMLKTDEEGIWTVNASDLAGKSLSYSVTWGDEKIYGTVAKESAVSQAPFIQTATFSHIYQNPGFYNPIFRVANDRGLEAKTSISVNVIEKSDVKPNSGYLQIEPSAVSLKVGESVSLKAIYEPPMPKCDTPGIACIQIMPAPVQVNADWSSSNPDVASVLVSKILCPRGAATCGSLQSVLVKGVSVGAAEIKAAYKEPTLGVTLIAIARVKVNGVSNSNAAPKITGIAGVPSSIQPGQVVSFSWSATDIDGDNLSWSGNWSDNTGYASVCPAYAPNNNFTVSHSWSQAGTYTVQISVSDCKGGSDTKTFGVTVGAAVK